MVNVPRFENTWTFGNTLTLIAMVLGGLMVYVDIASTMRVQERSMEQYSSMVMELRASLAQTEARTRALELNGGRVDEKLLAISASLQRIETAIGTKGKP